MEMVGRGRGEKGRVCTAQESNEPTNVLFEILVGFCILIIF